MLVNLPYKILIEKNVDDKLGDLFELLGSKRIDVVCSDNTLRVADEKIKSIKNANIINTKSMEKSQLESMAKKTNADIFVGVGGGRSIDIAKYVAYLAQKDWVAFPTVLSHDGVVSSRASIDNNGMKVSVEAKEPIAIIADLGILKDSPYRWAASGAGDILANLSAVEDWRIANRAGKENYHTVMAELSLLAVRSVIENISDIKKRSYHGMEMLLWSLVSSGFAMNIYGSSRPCSGSEHNFSHALEKLGAKALHGEQCALGSLVMLALQERDPGELRNYMKALGLPTTAKEIGIEENVLVEALVNARDVRERYTILNERKIDKNTAESLLKNVGII